MTSDSTLPSAPAKGDVGKGSPPQFGPVNPGFINGVQVPPRTSSAPPNLDEQNAANASHSAPRQQPVRIKRDVQMQPQKPSMGGMPMAYPMQFSGPQMSMQMSSQVQQQLYMPGLQHPRLMQPQGVIHQGQNLGFNPQTPGSLGTNAPPQFNQHRKSVKITHPETHEELRLDNRDGASRSHHSVSNYTQAHPIAYYPNYYAPGPPFYSAPNSHALPSGQLAAHRFNYPPASSFMNRSSNAFPNVDIVRDVHSIAHSASRPVTVKPAAFNKVESTKGLEVNSENSSRKSKFGFGSSKQSAFISEDATEKENNKSQKQSGKKGQFQLSQQDSDSSRVAAGDSTEAIVSHTSSGEAASIGLSLQSDNCTLDPLSRPNSSSTSNKTQMESNKAKSKKKRKETLQKTRSDLYMADKGRDDNSVDAEGRGDAADDSPKLECKGNLGGDTVVKSKKYSRDFLLTISEQCTDLPEGLDVTLDIVDVLVHDYPAQGRGAGRSFGGPQCGNNGMMNVDRWGRPSGWDPSLNLVYVNNMTGFHPNHGVLRHGPIQHWQRLMPYPLHAMHKADRKYEIGNITDEEQAKQRVLKAILNKLTPQNFEKLFEQVKQVNIDNAVTLTGVISQIFDKALMEPTFCEMYANFCSHLAMELPDLCVENEKITFRRLLLNKCQEEFEREEGEANKAEARRRMLGNIRLIGELYKKRMLTERIMHECINKLLGSQYQQQPDEENIEALCKLMSTIGDMSDHPKAKEHMDAYFDIMTQLSNNVKLSSRARFMLRDSIDLRKNKWQQRRKVEGPKKIDEVHRDAAQERHGQGQGVKQPRRGHILKYAPRGSVPSVKGGHTQARACNVENRSLSAPLHNRDEPNIANADTSSYSGENGHIVRHTTETPMLAAAQPQSMVSEKVWPQEQLQDVSIAAIKEYYSAKDEKEVGLCIKDLNSPSFYPTVISTWVTDAFERKDTEREMLANLLVSLARPEEGIFNANHLIQGFKFVLNNLEDTVNDAPRAAEFLGQIFGRVIIEKVISLNEAGRLIHEGGEEAGRLLEAGLAADVLGSILEIIQLEKGDSALNEIRTTSELRLEDFRPSGPRN